MTPFELKSLINTFSQKAADYAHLTNLKPSYSHVKKNVFAALCSRVYPTCFSSF